VGPRRAEQIDLLKRLKDAEEKHDFYSNLYRQNSINLLKLVIYVRSLITNERVAAHMQRVHADLFTKIQEIIANAAGDSQNLSQTGIAREEILMRILGRERNGKPLYARVVQLEERISIGAGGDLALGCRALSNARIRPCVKRLSVTLSPENSHKDFFSCYASLAQILRISPRIGDDFLNLREKVGVDSLHVGGHTFICDHDRT